MALGYIRRIAATLKGSESHYYDNLEEALASFWWLANGITGEERAYLDLLAGLREGFAMFAELTSGGP